MVKKHSPVKTRRLQAHAEAARRENRNEVSEVLRWFVVFHTNAENPLAAAGRLSGHRASRAADQARRRLRRGGVFHRSHDRVASATKGEVGTVPFSGVTGA